LLEVGAGTGSVYLLRWYWWRINSWSEIAAMSTALIVSVTFRVTAPFHGSEPAIFAKQTLATTLITTTMWLVVTLLTPAEPSDTLVRFYRRVRPDVFGWKPIAALAEDVSATKDLGRNLVDWIIGCAMVYAALFGVGKFCLLEFWQGSLFMAFSISCAAFIYHSLNQAY
jgi:Na+/proline symporter